MMFDRYEIQSQPTVDTDVDEHEEQCLQTTISYEVVLMTTPDEEQATNNQVADADTANLASPPEEAKKEQDYSSKKSPLSCARVITWVQYTVSTLLLLFSATLVFAAIGTKQTTVSQSTHPLFAAIVLVVLFLWLAVMEGGQGCLVGLQPRQGEAQQLYAQTHPWTYKCTAVMARQDGNLERFIVGRQFLVVLVVFGINMCGSAVANAQVLGLPQLVQEIFLASGVALMLLTIVVGQLTAQVNAANCMLDFINHRFMLMTVWISLAMEASGLLHAVYLVQMVFGKISGKVDEKQQEKSTCEKLYFGMRVFFSLAVLGFAFAVTLSALFQGQTAMWEGVPEAASVVIFFVLMCFVGLMEGMQIALYAVVNLPVQQVEQYPIAKKNCQLVFQEGSSRFQAFLIGRQICVTICMFLVARITTIQASDDGDETIFGVPQGVQEFFQTGLLGAVITTIIGSLAWRVVASSFPLAFLSNPLIYIIIRLCLYLEASGVCTSAWMLAVVHKRLAGLQTDDVYLGKETTKDVTEREPATSEEEC